ncbi:FabD/lysophospholipase-like protein [Periconia macrospinosa]|uniref:FabD/lysophospholipase-like protein n=1 Tax=Periconia macrospinosa TaxID=97972 RepID=A0A2V1E5R9_9PLEO|nr:FabD/lysophospholipase-like protein [Periconia macrospinosa]
MTVAHVTFWSPGLVRFTVFYYFSTVEANGYFNDSRGKISLLHYPARHFLLDTKLHGPGNFTGGIPLKNVVGTKTSVFVGSFATDYTVLLKRDPEAVPMYQCTNSGQSRAMSLHTGEASATIASGVNVILNHEFMNTMTTMKFLSPDGRCYTFGERGNGYARGEGVGTAPGGPLETRALSNLFCGPDRPADDPLMIGSIKSNVGHMGGASVIGAVVKAILMLEQEVVLPNRNFKNPSPRIPFDEWKLKVVTKTEPWRREGPLRVSINSFGYGGSNAHAVLELPRTYLSSHGLGGNYKIAKQIVLPQTKAHVNENSPAPFADHGHLRLFIFNAFDETGGQRQAESLANHIRETSQVRRKGFLDDLVFTLNERRTDFIRKSTVIAGSSAELATSLSMPLKFSRSFKKPVLGFVFTGQGAQWCGMGKELLNTFPLFKNTIAKIGRYLHSIGAPFDEDDEITKDPKLSKVNTALYSQPMCSAIHIALIEVLNSWDIKPTSVTGHSSGEIASAYAIGALSMEDAMAAAYYRGVCSTKMQEKAEINGAMMAAGISEEAATPFLAGIKTGKAGVACVNSPSSVTISGDVSAIDELQKVLESKTCFRASILHIQLRTGNGVKFYSSVFGKEITADDLRPDFANLLGQVKFSESLRQLCLSTGGAKKRRQAKGGNVNFLVEIGPHSALAGPIKQILEADPKLKEAGIAYSSALERKSEATNTALDLAGKLVEAGHVLDFAAVNRAQGKAVVFSSTWDRVERFAHLFSSISITS